MTAPTTEVLAAAGPSDDLAYTGTWVRVGLLLVPAVAPATKRVPRRPPAKCGTDGGYYRHVRITKTKACDDCRAAHAAAQRGRAT